MADQVVESYKSETEQNFDAELLKEAIAEGETKEIGANVSADYEAAQQMSQSAIGAEEAEALVAPQFEVAKPEEVVIPSTASSGSVDYADMAKNVNPAPVEAGNVTDSLVEKALEMGKPGQ
jgi:hypothetical protein